MKRILIVATIINGLLLILSFLVSFSSFFLFDDPAGFNWGTFLFLLTSPLQMAIILFSSWGLFSKGWRKIGLLIGLFPSIFLGTIVGLGLYWGIY